MITKLFEIRDRGTLIPVLAVQLEPRNEAERWLLERAGYGPTAISQSRYILLCRIDGGGGMCHCDPYDWGGNPRTLLVAHEYLMEMFDHLDSGAVVDVEYILGETQEPKRPQRLDKNPWDN
jgi:hypothetical protein